MNPTETVMAPRLWSYPVTVLALAAVYFGAAKVGLSLGFDFDRQVSVVWPPTGIALAALLIGGYRLWPGIALGAFLANATADEPSVAVTLVAGGIAAGNTLEAVVGSWLLRRVVGFRNHLGRLKDVLSLIIIAAGLSTVVSATIGSTCLCVGGRPWSAYLSLWWVWWLGDAMGDLVMAPVLLTWAASPWLNWSGRRLIEVAGFLVGLVAVTVLVFAETPLAVRGYPREYIIFPFLIAAALGFGQRGAATGIVITWAIAILLTLRGSGPFTTATRHESLVLLHLYMAVLAVTVLLLGAATTERRMAERRRDVEHAITAVLAESPSVADVAPRLLRMIGESLKWDIGTFWILDRQNDVLRCVNVWHRPSTPITEFARAMHGIALARGVGLPGRVWAAHRPDWSEDVMHDANFPRASIARREGLHGAFAFPIVLGSLTLGTLEFLSRQVQPRDDDLLEMLMAGGGQIGLFIERRRAEEELAQSQAALEQQHHLLRTITDNAASCLCLIDERGHATYVNPAFEQVTGFRLEEVRDRPIHDVIHHHRPDGRPYARGECPLDRSAQDGVLLRECEDVFIRKDGTFFPVRCNLVPLHAQGMRGAVGEFRDITSEKKVEEVMREADRRKDEFLAVLAHELRNPLAPIRNNLHILKMPGADDATAREAREVIERQVQHLVRLVDDLLDVSRIVRGKIELRKAPIDLATALDRAIETARPAIDSAGHALTVTSPPGPIVLEADLVRLSQVIANLLNNAAKYTEPGGRITLTVRREGDEVVVSVRDTGIGISAEVLPQIFDMFVQADPALGRAQGGMGIGLTLVRTLVEHHGGSVRAVSDGPGKGSEFIVRLPALRGAAPRDPADEADGAAPLTAPSAAIGGRRILVVDDNIDAAESLAVMLRLHGQNVRVVHSGPAALEAAGGQVPDIVFLDIGMPGMDGYEVARRLRCQRGLDATTIIALTGWGQEEDRRLAREAGFDHHLVKPVEPKVLQQMLALPSRLPKASETSEV
jgi:PAS domain S-box-containing protein